MVAVCSRFLKLEPERSLSWWRGGILVFLRYQFRLLVCGWWVFVSVPGSQWSVAGCHDGWLCAFLRQLLGMLFDWWILCYYVSWALSCWFYPWFLMRRWFGPCHFGQLEACTGLNGLDRILRVVRFHIEANSIVWWTSQAPLLLFLLLSEGEDGRDGGGCRDGTDIFRQLIWCVYSIFDQMKTPPLTVFDRRLLRWVHCRPWEHIEFRVIHAFYLRVLWRICFSKRNELCIFPYFYT